MIETQVPAPPQGSKTGFVVESTNGLFLSRSMRFVEHRDEMLTRGIEKGWVHAGDELRAKTGDWTKSVARVYPARYDRVADRTQIIGAAKPYEEAFL